MQIWIDADACPVMVKEILFRAAKRLKVQITLVANKRIRVPHSEYISTVQVKAGFDVADEWIVEKLQPGDLVITADIPLASQVIKKDASALNPRGTFYTEENIQNYLAQRNLMDELRSTGVITGGGPPTLGKKDTQAFANQLDKFLTRWVSSSR